ncbi:MAG: hypothetical protein LBS53_08520, partial [Synergistaceae bacterium]|nr:hypothetical protein [Synergistaceae bacterium]
ALTHPFPGAFTFSNGKKLLLWEARPCAVKTSPPGTVVSPAPLIVGTGAGALRIDRAQWEGEDELNGSELGIPEDALLTGGGGETA